MTVNTDRNRLSQHDIDRMIKDAERFAEDDSTQRKHVETLNSLSSYVYTLKAQLRDKEGFGRRISGDEKNQISQMVIDTEKWIDENEKTASLHDLEDRLQGKCIMKNCA